MLKACGKKVQSLLYGRVGVFINEFSIRDTRIYVNDWIYEDVHDNISVTEDQSDCKKNQEKAI